MFALFLIGYHPKFIILTRRLESRRQQKTWSQAQLKGMKNDTLDVLDPKNAAMVGGGVGDTFGEDATTEEKTLTL